MLTPASCRWVPTPPPSSFVKRACRAWTAPSARGSLVARGDGPGNCVCIFFRVRFFSPRSATTRAAAPPARGNDDRRGGVHQQDTRRPADDRPYRSSSWAPLPGVTTTTKKFAKGRAVRCSGSWSATALGAFREWMARGRSSTTTRCGCSAAVSAPLEPLARALRGSA